MADNINGVPFSNSDEGADFPFLAKELVLEQALKLGVRDDHPDFDMTQIYVVWFAYTMGHFKALCSTSIPDGRYYEVTYTPHNDGKHIAFVDTYLKTHNVAVEITFHRENNA